MRSVDLQRHEMHVAFMCGSTCGWVYVETTMTPTFQCLLSLIPGVISPNHGLIKFFIDILDHVGVITSSLKSILKLDIGRAFFEAHTRMISALWLADMGCHPPSDPRLLPAWDNHDLTSTRKQKRHQQTPHPLPALFNVFQFVASWGGSFATPLHKEPRFTIGTLLFECGLLWKDFNYCTITTVCPVTHHRPPWTGHFWPRVTVTCHRRTLHTIQWLYRFFLIFLLPTGFLYKIWVLYCQDFEIRPTTSTI